MFSDSIFLFCVYSELPPSTEYNSSASFGDYEITFPGQTPFTRAFLDGRELLILGLAADVRNGQWENLPQTMLENTQSLQDVICYEAHLGGKYILFYKDVSGTYAIPDATASIPFCYTTKGNPLLCASDSEAIAAALSLSPNAELLHIRNSGDLSQAMPYDLTVYEEVLQLLPNHYYSFAEQKAFRFVNFKSKQSALSATEAADQTAPLIKNLLNYYSKQFPLQCPLTSGWDSRVVLSTMLSMDEKVETYTIRHNHFSATEPDVVIPQKIAEAFPVTNIQIPDMHPHTQLCEEFSSRFGATGYSLRTLMIANTIKSVYGDCAVINGDIIGQVGKCSLHRDISEKFATAKYFRCKLHNYSKASVKHIDRWLADIRAAGEQVNVFDLFSMESRMGRWAAQENLIYGMLGQKYLNIFNSRAIVYPWTCVPREDRKLSCIHKALIHMTYPELMRIPVGGKPSLAERITKHNGFTYYLASFVKYYFEKAIFLCKKR